jgi:prolipoprotein diacylglyceryltransferase
LYEAFCYVFVFCDLVFLILESQTKSGFYSDFSCYYSPYNCCRICKESQGGFESTLGLLSTGQWLSIPFIIIGLYFIFTAEKPVKFRSCLKVISKSDIKKASGNGSFSILSL